MKGKDILAGKGIEVIKQDKRITVSQKGVVISRKGKPVKNEVTGTGYVYLVIDCSGSMAGQKIEQAKRGAINFAKDARTKGYSIGLIQFESSATHICGPIREISALDRYLKTMKIGGTTNMADGIQLATRELQRKRGYRAMVIITDGMPNVGEPTGEKAALREAEKAKENRIDIITIGTDDADWEFLKKIATRANLAAFVTREELAQAITSAAQMLPKPR